jgi:hypothetical protein
MIKKINIDKRKMCIFSVSVLIVVIIVVTVCYLIGVNPLNKLVGSEVTTTTSTTAVVDYTDYNRVIEPLPEEYDSQIEFEPLPEPPSF